MKLSWAVLEELRWHKKTKDFRSDWLTDESTTLYPLICNSLRGVYLLWSLNFHNILCIPAFRSRVDKKIFQEIIMESRKDSVVYQRTT